MKIKIKLLGQSSHKLQAVKLIKEFSGLGLKEAKALLDIGWSKNPSIVEFEIEEKSVSHAKFEFESIGLEFSKSSREDKLKRILYDDQSVCMKDMLTDVSNWDTIGIITDEDRNKLTYNECRKKAVEKIYNKYVNYIKLDSFSEVFFKIQAINKKETKTLPIKFIKFNEEFGEMCSEFLKFDGYTYKEFNVENLKSEMADALQVLLSIYAGIEEKTGITISEVLDEIKVKNVKWESNIKNYTIGSNIYKND